MRWRRAGMVACAATVITAGAVTAVAGALDADQATTRPVSASRDVTGPGPGATAAFSSQLTITLDPPPGACASFPDADGSGRPHQVCGPILGCYRRLDGPRGPLGLPTGDERANRYQPALLGDRAGPFRGGTIYLKRASGELSVGRWYVSSPSTPAETPEPVPQC